MDRFKLFAFALFLILGGAIMASCGGKSPTSGGSSAPKTPIGNITANINGAVVTGTTVGSTNKLNMGSCGGVNRGDDSPENVYAIDIDKNATPNVTFSLCGGATWDTLLYLMEGNNVDVCSDDYCGSQSAIGVLFNKSKRYYVVVDGYGGAQGSYSLTVTAP